MLSAKGKEVMKTDKHLDEIIDMLSEIVIKYLNDNRQASEVVSTLVEA